MAITILKNLKSLVMAALFFKDDAVLEKALTDFKSECREEILTDGMHFELSPMYHKIIFEGMLRVATAFRGLGQPDKEIESHLQSMLDVAYSFENGLERVPLFNDGGNNVAKSLNALVITAERRFGLRPKFKGRLESSGFYIFKRKLVKKMDTRRGRWTIGPKYILVILIADAMSFELFCNGNR